MVRGVAKRPHDQHRAQLANADVADESAAQIPPAFAVEVAIELLSSATFRSGSGQVLCQLSHSVSLLRRFFFMLNILQEMVMIPSPGRAEVALGEGAQQRKGEKEEEKGAHGAAKR